MKFNGDKDSVEIAPSPQLDLTEEYAFSAWIYLEAFGYGARILDKSIEGVVSAYSFDILDNWGRSYLRLCTAGACVQSRYGLLHLFQWTHVAVTFSVSGKRIRFYIDGEAAGQAGVSEAARVSAFPLRLGGPSQRRSGVGSGAGVNLLGAIDSVSVWNRALSQGEVRKLLFRRPRRNESNLVAFWGFDESEGSKTFDSSTNELHGVLKGGAHRIAAPRRPVPNMRGVTTLPLTDADYLWYGAALGIVGSLMAALLIVLIILVRLNCAKRTQPRERSV